ncbi:hypothetical protein D3C72_1546710 [compost metagenome]
MQGLDGGVAGAGRGLMVDDHEQAAGLQRLEDVGVHLGHVHAEPGDVEVVVFLAHEDHVQRLVEGHGVQVAVDAADVGIGGDQGVGARVLALGGLVRHEGVDVAALAHHAGKQAGEVAGAGADVGDALTRLNLGEGEDFGRVAQRIASDLVSRAQGIGDGALDQRRRGGLCEGRRTGEHQGGQGGDEQGGLHETTSEKAGRHKARAGGD